MNEQLFIEEIKRRPMDDEPRLIFSDWLEERDDPRAELIRVQCQIWRTDENECGEPERREQQILKEFQSQWEEPIRKLGASGIKFRRGFIYHVCISPQSFVENTAEIMRISPLLYSLDITELPSTHIDAIQTTEVPFSLDEREPGSAWKDFTRCSALSQIGELSLRQLELSNRAIKSLATGPALRRLVSLSLNSTELRDGMIGQLVASRILRPRRLYLGNNYLTDRGLETLVNSALFSRLHLVDLRFNSISQVAKEELKERFGRKVMIDD